MALVASSSTLAEGYSAPPFELRGTDDQLYTPASFDEAAAVLIVFTCNHCPYAEAKLPALNTLATEVEGLAVVGINPNDAEAYPEDSFERMRERVAAGEVRFDAYLRDATQETARAYDAVCTPDPFLFRVDAGGLDLVFHSRIDDAMGPEEQPERFEMREAAEAVIAGEPIPVDPTPSRGCSIKWTS
jgi:peroxiredoxin